MGVQLKNIYVKIRLMLTLNPSLLIGVRTLNLSNLIMKPLALYYEIYSVMEKLF